MRGLRRELTELSVANFSNLEDTAQVFQRFRIGTEDLGKARAEIVDFTDLIQKTAVTSGANATETNNALIQLGQGLSSGQLRGEEFRSVAEQLPTVLRVLKRELQLTTGELREAAFAGELTTEIIFEAFQNQRDTINAEFKNLRVTRSLALQQFKTGFTAFFGSFAQGARFNDDLAALFSGVGKFFVENERLARKLGMAYQDVFVAVGDGIGAVFGENGLGNAVSSGLGALGRTLEQYRSSFRSYAQLRENGFGRGDAFELSAAGIFGDDAAKRIASVGRALKPIGQAIAFIFGARVVRGIFSAATGLLRFVTAFSPLRAALVVVAAGFAAFNRENSALRRLWDRLRAIWNGDGSGEGLGDALGRLGRVLLPVMKAAFNGLVTVIEVVANILIGIVDALESAYNFGKKIVALSGQGTGPGSFDNVTASGQLQQIQRARLERPTDFTPKVNARDPDEFIRQFNANQAARASEPQNVTVNATFTPEQAARFTDAIRDGDGVFSAVKRFAIESNLAASTGAN